MASVAEVYRLTKKSPDLPWNEYVCRPLAAVLVRSLEGTRATPDQVTLASFGVALVSVGLLLALPGYAGLVAAVVLFELSYVLDCADGMLARLRGTASVPGHLFDFLMDELKAFLVLGAVSVRLFREHGDPAVLLVGIGGLVAVASGIALTTFVRRPEIAGPAAPQGAPKASGLSPVRLVEGLARLVIHYPSYLLFVALAGRLEFYLYPYVAVNAAYAAREFLRVARRFSR